MNQIEIRMYCSNMYKQHKKRVDELKEKKKQLRELNYNYLIDNMDFYELSQLFPNTKKSKYTKNEIKEILTMFHTNEFNKLDDCPICFSYLQSDLRDDNEDIVKFPCHHTFHSSCLCTWVEKSFTCPMCRYDLLK